MEELHRVRSLQPSECTCFVKHLCNTLSNAARACLLRTCTGGGHRTCRFLDFLEEEHTPATPGSFFSRMCDQTCKDAWLPRP